MYEEVTKTILNVGVDDHDITLFENQYDLPDGMAYNSYLIVDDKVCIMDGVDADVTEEWLANIDKALSDAGKSAIDYLVVQHMEPDHSGAILALVKKFPDIKIYTSVGAVNMMKQFFDEDLSDKITTVKEGDTLELGSHKLSFIGAPMVHWPEVMMTYESSEKVLFSADGFGKFGYKGAEADDWACEARRYYFNIVGKYGAQVAAVLKKAEGLDIEHICSLHGPVLPENEPLEFYINKYKTWSAYEPEDSGVAVIFAADAVCRALPRERRPLAATCGREVPARGIDIRERLFQRAVVLERHLDAVIEAEIDGVGRERRARAHRHEAAEHEGREFFIKRMIFLQGLFLLFILFLFIGFISE